MKALKTLILLVTALAVTTAMVPQASSQTPPPAQQPPPPRGFTETIGGHTGLKPILRGMVMSSFTERFPIES